MFGWLRAAARGRSDADDGKRSGSLCSLVEAGPARPRLSSRSRRLENPIATQAAPLVAHVIYRLDLGGLENGLVNLINGMAGDEMRHSIICLDRATAFAQRLRGEVEVIEMHKRSGKDLRLLPRLWSVFRRLRPAIVHTRNLAALETQLPAWIAGVPRRVHGEHGSLMRDLGHRSRRYRRLRRCYAPMIQRFVPLSRELEAYLHEDIGVPRRKLRRICNGVDTVRFRPGNRARWRANLPFAAGDRLLVGTLGRMVAEKDQLTLARAFVRLVQQTDRGDERLGLVMLGDGALRGRILAELKAAGLGSISWLPGSRNDASDYLRALDVFVLPSLTEGISNALLEAMASGLPAVVTAVGGNSELVADADTGFLVPRGDPPAMCAALARYVDDGGLRTAHGIAARRRAEALFSLDRMVQAYRELYREMLQV
jgi:sugar transferase (PEP-CTERM/EpsH1 system associated)